MTHAECQELLIELIYGELAPARAAEVELHLAGCAGCRAQRDALSGTRAALAPVMSGTDSAESVPGKNFDLPILAAAREAAAEMARAKAAPIAQVISLAEVRAAANAGVADSQRTRRAPHWMRATLAGSIAAAAALALVVGTRSHDEIAGVPPRSAEELQVAERKGAEARAAQLAQAPAPPATPPAPGAVAQEEHKEAEISGGVVGGVVGGVAGGAGAGMPKDAAAPGARGSAGAASAVDKLDQRAFAPPPPGWPRERAQTKSAKRPDGFASDDGRASLDADAPEPAPANARGGDAKERAAASDLSARRDAAATAEQDRTGLAEGHADAKVEMARAKEPMPMSPAAAAAPAPPPPALAVLGPSSIGATRAAPASAAKPASDDGAGLEAEASAARVAGQLRDAGRLYREAAGAFFASSNPDDAARGTRALVSAVSCYAQAGDLAEARKVRDLLVSLAPDQSSAIAQANARISAREAPPKAAPSAPPASGR